MYKLEVQFPYVESAFFEPMTRGEMLAAVAFRIMADDLPGARIPEVSFAINALIDTITFYGDYADLQTMFDNLIQAPDVNVKGEVTGI